MSTKNAKTPLKSVLDSIGIYKNLLRTQFMASNDSIKYFPLIATPMKLYSELESIYSQQSNQRHGKHFRYFYATSNFSDQNSNILPPFLTHTNAILNYAPALGINPAFSHVYKPYNIYYQLQFHIS